MIGLKNDVDQVWGCRRQRRLSTLCARVPASSRLAAAQVGALVSHFDFAVVEQCFQYNECDAYLPFVQQNKAVLICEYAKLSKVAAACPAALERGFSLIRKTYDLKASPLYQCLAD